MLRLRDRQVYAAAGNNNGRNVPRFWPFGEFLEKFVAAQAGHVDVENDEIRRVIVDGAQRGPSVDDVDRLETGDAQHTSIKTRECDIVFDNENPLTPANHHVQNNFNFYSVLDFRSIRRVPVELSTGDAVISSIHGGREASPDVFGSPRPPARWTSRRRFREALVPSARVVARGRIDDVRQLEAHPTAGLMDFTSNVQIWINTARAGLPVAAAIAFA
jgi:hypothetical protein